MANIYGLNWLCCVFLGFMVVAMTNPMTNPVAPVVTDEMLNAAEDAYDKVAYYDGVDHCYADPLRAAITAAFEASGELERLRAHLSANLDWMEALRASGDAGFWNWDADDAYTKARTALEGGTV
jgi:hypothetical protein